MIFRPKAVFSLLLALLTLCGSKTESAYTIDISAESYVLYCPQSDEVILEKNAHKRSLIASTTKIMTALLALETAKIKDECITITEQMVNVEGSSMGLKEGQILPLSSLAKGALTVSGNDAANSIAISLGGSFENFSRLMNIKAKEIKMKNTNFVTPSGLDAKDHYSTAYDLALLASSAMENKDFFSIVSSLKTDVFYKNPNKKVPFYNENKLLKKYEGCLGIKTGFTKAAGRCLVSCAQRENLRLIAVTLRAPDDWNDHSKLFDYGFNNFKAILPKKEELSVPIVGSVEERAFLKTLEPVKIVVKKHENPEMCFKVETPKFLYAPVHKNSKVGSISYYIDKKIYKKYPLILVKDYKSKKQRTNFLKKIGNFFEKIAKKILKSKNN